jgi:midasin
MRHVTIGRVELLRVVVPVDDGTGTAPPPPPQQQQIDVALARHTRCLITQLAACVRMREPVLLVGETGAGKTTVIQHLAAVLGQKLIVQNLNVQTDSSDILGGFRPVQMRQLVVPV